MPIWWPQCPLRDLTAGQRHQLGQSLPDGPLDKMCAHGRIWWLGRRCFLVWVVPYLDAPCIFFPLYVKKHESLALGHLVEWFISAYLCQLFPSDLDALLLQLLSAETLNSGIWAVEAGLWGGVREGKVISCLLICCSLCPGRYLPLLCVSRACFLCRRLFFSLGSLTPLAVEQLRDPLLREDQTMSPSLLQQNHVFFDFLHQQDWCKETKSEDRKLLFACCWNYTGKFFKEKKITAFQSFSVQQGNHI